MGCCKSSSNINISRLKLSNLPLTEDETIHLETFLCEIPDHCRQVINNLPKRQLFNLIQQHRKALYYGSRRDWPLVISKEYHVIKGFQALLPKDKDHYIFFNFYSILSASFLALGEFESAIEGIHISLAILLKHTPMDYRTISQHYYYLANTYKVLQNWKTTIQYLTNAIELAQFINDLDEKYIYMLENELQIVKQKITKDTLHDLTFVEIQRKHGENDYDFHRRMTAKMIISNVKHGTLDSDKDEFEYLSDKQMTNEILEDISIDSAIE